MVVVLLVAACSSGGAPVEEEGARDVAEAPAAAPSEARAPDRPATPLSLGRPAEKVVATDPSVSLMEQLAAATLGMATVIDDDRGFVYVEIREDAGEGRIAARLCGEAAHEQAATLQRDLAGRAFRCAGPVCTHPARDTDDFAGSYSFQAPDDRLVLGVVVRIAAEPATEGAQRRLEHWIDERVATLLGEPCPAPTDRR